MGRTNHLMVSIINPILDEGVPIIMNWINPCNHRMQLILLFMLTSMSQSLAQIDSVFISNVKFSNGQFNNDHAGSGFLVSYKGKTFACTAKHVLLFAKTDSMQSISFGDDLKSWTFTSATHKENNVLAGRLVNEDPNEKIVMPPEGDWLIFEVNDVPEGVAIYKLREGPLTSGESVSFLGFPYGYVQPIRVKGEFIGFTTDFNLSLNVPKGTYNGCSGGPVVDEEGRLVGLVSMGYFDAKENKMVFEPASLSYFKSIIDNAY